MNLTSCTNCGVVLDKDQLRFPKDIHLENGSVDTKLGVWNGDDYVPFVPCPICQQEILK